MKKEVSIGRPPKFQEECRPVTVTLPLRILRQLEEFDTERGKAIVKCVEATIGATSAGEEQLVELVPVAEGAALLVVGRSRYLKNIPWLRLIEITPARYLLSIPTGTAVESFELAIMDVVETIPKEEVADKNLLSQIRHYLSRYRRSNGLSKGEILFVAI